MGLSPLSVRELTASGRGAVRVLELAGDDALERVARLAPRARLSAGELAVVELRDARGELLDEAVVIARGPELVELHLHGAPALVARVVVELGAAPREPAPLSIEELAEERLAAAPSEAAARTLLDQAEGALRRELEALLELAPEPRRAAARELARRGRVARALVEPPRVVLAGPVNAGKSTLFNALVGRERVVVDASEGTTRDAVRERVRLGAYAVDLVDTAGERELGSAVPSAEREVEREGQALAAELRASADLVLWLAPPGSRMPAAVERTRVVRSLADLDPTRSRAVPAVAALRDPSRAKEVVTEVVLDALELPRAPWVRGAGVPFETSWTERLARAEPDELAHIVRGWLAAGAAGR